MPQRTRIITHDPVARLQHWLDHGPQRILIGLAGLPGSGKSTLAQVWREQLQARRGAQAIDVLGMDGFHLSRAELLRMPEPDRQLARRGAPWTFDAPALRERLLRLRQQPAQPVPWPAFDHAQGDPVPDALRVAPETRIVLVEGLYLLHQDDQWRMQDLFDERWYLDVPPQLAHERLCARHMQAWGLSREQALQRIAGNDALNAQIVLASRERADAWVTPAAGE